MKAFKKFGLVLLILSVVLLVQSFFIYKRAVTQVDNTENLIKQLQSFDWNLRAQAAEALGKTGDSRAIRPLVAALKDDDSDVRKKAAEALDKFGWQPKNETQQRLYFIAKKDWDKCVELNGATVESLIGVLRDKDPHVRKKAAEALGQMENPVIKPLAAALRDDKRDVRNKAAEALIEIGGIGVIKPFIAALKDKHSYTRQTAAESLGRIGDRRAVKPLVAALSDTNWKVRETAAESLGRIGDRRALEPLVAALRDTNWKVRETAAQNLGWIGDDRAVMPLVVALKDDDSDVRQKAAEALDKLGWKPKNKAQQRYYFIAKKDWDKCAELDGVTVRALINILKDKDPQVRKKATETLVRIGGQGTMEPLIVALKHKNNNIRKEAAETLGNIGDGSAVKPLIEVLKDKNPDVRKAAMDALIKMGSFHTIGPLSAALEDRDSNIREAAVEILGKISNPALEPLIAALWDKNWEVRTEATKALGKLGDSRAVKPLIAVLNYEAHIEKQEIKEDLSGATPLVSKPFVAPSMTDNTRLRIEVIKALGQIGDERAVPALVGELQCTDTVQAATYALEKLNWSPQSVEDKVHFLVAKKDGNALRQNWEQTKRVLLNDLKSDETKIVKNALCAFIALGNEEIIKELIETLNLKGDITIAEFYRNCGNKSLSSAARLWETKHGYYATVDFVSYQISWGSW